MAQLVEVCTVQLHCLSVRRPRLLRLALQRCVRVLQCSKTSELSNIPSVV